MKTWTLVATLALVGCAQPGPKPLYQWAGYQPAVYQYLKSNGVEGADQLAPLEAQLAKNDADGVASPPGMRAHIGLLHSKAGNDAAAQRYLEAERAQFPESSAYIDFLLKSTRKDGGKANAVAPNAAASQPRT